MPIPYTQFEALVSAFYGCDSHAKRTKAKMRWVLSLVRELGPESTADLTTVLVAKYVEKRREKVSTNTIRGELDYLRAACNLAVEEGWLDRPPRFRRVKPRAVPSRAHHGHQLGEIRRLLEHLEAKADTWASHRLFALAATVAYTGLRRDEALTLRVEDVSLTAGLLLISDRTRRKTVKAASPVPIPPELAKILAGWLDQVGSPWLFPGVKRRGPWTGGAWGDRAVDHLKRAGEAVGVTGLTFASLRHTFATHARRVWGLSALELAEVLRHTSPTTQRWYIDQAEPEQLVASVRRVSYRAH